MDDFAWIKAMQEKLHQFNRLDVWELVDKPLCKNVINMKWLWKNKCDEENTVIRIKAHLVAKGYGQNIDTAMATKHLNADLSGTPVNQTKYRSMVEALMYLTLTDYGFHFDKIPIYYDSKAAIAISCNPVQHSHTKHINIRYHFIKEQVKKGIVELFFVRTEYQLADLFTKALPKDRFKYLVRRLGMRGFTPEELKVRANKSAQFLGGDKLVSCSSKKHDCTVMSSAEAELHFIKKQVEKDIVELFFVGTEYQLADLFSKALPEDRQFKSGPQSQENVPQAAETVTTSNELDLLFSLMFDELLNGTTLVVSKSSVVTTVDAPDQR
nr:retrotransposon protein, putative, unclassified [Tanacetum cinerariifolium]